MTNRRVLPGPLTTLFFFCLLISGVLTSGFKLEKDAIEMTKSGQMRKGAEPGEEQKIKELPATPQFQMFGRGGSTDKFMSKGPFGGGKEDDSWWGEEEETVDAKYAFKQGDVDVALLKRTLRNYRASDQLIMKELGLRASQLADLNEDQVVQAFNALLAMDNFYSRVEINEYRLEGETLRLLDRARQAGRTGSTLVKDDLAALNRGLIESIYAQEMIQPVTLKQDADIDLSEFDDFLFDGDDEEAQ